MHRSRGRSCTDHVIDHALIKDRKELHIAIQVSLDGPDCVTLKNRGIKESFITNNIISLIEELNKFKFKKLKVGFIFKPTIPVEDYNKIHGNIQEATEYYEYWANLLKTLNEVNNSLNVEHIRAVQVLHAGIYNHTQQEGLDLTRSLNVYNALDWGRINDIAQYNLRKDMSFFNYIEEWTGRANEFAETSPYCGSFVGSLFIRPDGSLIGCLAGLLNDNPEYNKYLEENNIESEIKITNMTPSKLYFNPLKATKEQIDNFFEHKNSMQYRSDRIWYALSASMLYELAYAGQADPRYIHDKNLLLRHCYLLMARIECWYNNVRNTGSSYITLPGVLRLYGNGAMFVFEDYINNLDRYIGERGLNNEPFVDCENRG